MIKLYVGEPVVVHFAGSAGLVTQTVDQVVEIAETTGGSLLISTDTERLLCPPGTWGRLSWGVTR